MSDKTQTGTGEWANGWPIVLASLVGIMLCLSPLPYWALAVIGEELGKEFGWDRPTITAGFLYMTAGVLVSAPIAGLLVDKIGARKVLLPSIVALGLGTMSFALMTSDPRVFYLIFFITAVLGTGTLPITWTKAIVNNFDRYRGLALGIALTGTGLYGFVATPSIQFMIDQFGWRAAYVSVGALPILFSLPIAYILFKDEKEKAGLTTSDNSGVGRLLMMGLGFAIALFVSMQLVTTAAGFVGVIALMALFLIAYLILVYVRSDNGNAEVLGLTIRQTMKNYRFWVILFAFLLLGAVVSGIIANSKYILLDKGYSPQDATHLFIGAGVIGLSTLTGRILGGWLVDHFWAPMIAFVFMSLPALGCFILAEDMGIGMNVLALVLVGLAAGVEFDLMAYFVSRYFGMKSYALIYGLIYAAFGLGSGTSPIIFNILRGDDADYSNVLKLVAMGFIIGAALLLTLGKYRDFEKETIIKV
ncbi:MAG: MFS transporter [Hellea sp.]